MRCIVVVVWGVVMYVDVGGCVVAVLVVIVVYVMDCEGFAGNGVGVAYDVGGVMWDVVHWCVVDADGRIFAYVVVCIVMDSIGVDIDGVDGVVVVIRRFDVGGGGGVVVGDVDAVVCVIGRYVDGVDVIVGNCEGCYEY